MDFSSTCGCFAATRISAIVARRGRKVAWRPMLLGTALKVTGAVTLRKALMISRRMPFL
jgi:2-hydroxychromene-2-carboxylate isomerase